LLIRIGYYTDIPVELIQSIKANLEKWPTLQKEMVEEFDKALQEIEQAKQEVIEARNAVKNLLADQEHLKNLNLTHIVQDYLNDDVLYASIAPQIEALKTELAAGLAQCEAHYQAEKRLKQELERKKQLEESERFKRETGIDFEANEQLSIGNFNPGELSFGAFPDDFDGFGLASNSHNGVGSSSYTQYQPIVINAGVNGMSQSLSHNGSQSSSSNADWLRAHSASQSSSSHNGLSNAAHNGMQLESNLQQSQSLSSSDAPHGKGEKRKFDEEDNGKDAKRARTDNGNSSSSNASQSSSSKDMDMKK
jgi:hypothetical protein